MNIYLATGAALLVYLICVWFLGNLLHLHGRDLWVLRIGLAVIGIIGAGVFLWFKRRERKLAAGEGSQDTGGPAHEVSTVGEHEVGRQPEEQLFNGLRDRAPSGCDGLGIAKPGLLRPAP